MKWIDKIDRFFVASEYELKIYTEAFGIPENRFIISGNPRNDKLHSHKKVNKNKNYGRTILYAPTFRVGKGGAHDQESIHMHPEIDERGCTNFWWKMMLNSLLGLIGCQLPLSLHPTGLYA